MLLIITSQHIVNTSLESHFAQDWNYFHWANYTIYCHAPKFVKKVMQGLRKPTILRKQFHEKHVILFHNYYNFHFIYIFYYNIRLLYYTLF
jgi:hypothetical protein